MSTDPTQLGGAPAAPPPGAAPQQPTGPPIPVDDYERLRVRDRVGFANFSAIWKDKRDKYYLATREDFFRLHSRNLITQNYLDSKHFRHIDPETGKMREFTPEREWAHVDNQFEYFIESMVSNAVKSTPGLVVKIRTDDKTAQSDLRMAQHYVDCDRPFSDRDYALLEYLRFLRARVWAYSFPSMTGPKITEPTYGEQQAGAGAPAQFYCPECGRAGQTPPVPEGVPDTGTCPFCGAADIVTLAASEAPSVMGQTGERERATCAVTTLVVDDFNMRWYLPSGDPMKSPFLCYDRMELREDVYRKYPWLRPLQGSSAYSGAGDDIHLKAKDESQRSAGNWNLDPWVVSRSTGSAVDSLRCHVQDMWLVPSQYENDFHEIPQGIPLANGVVIPPNVPLGKIFTKGICVVFVDGEMVDIRPNEFFPDMWDTDEFKPNPAGGTARGAEVMVPNQNIHNALRLYVMALMATEANANIIVHPGKISDAEERKKIGKPGRWVLAHGLLPGETPAAAAQRLQAGPPSALVEAAQIEERNIGSMQAHSQTYAVQPNVDKAPINTATGVNEMAAQIEALAEPRLKRRAAFMASVAEKRLRFACEYDYDERYYARAGDSGREIGKWIAPARLKGQFFVEFDPDSHVVRTVAQKKSDVAIGVPLAIQALAVPVPAIAENLFRIVMETFNLDDLVSDGVRDSESIAYKRIEAIRDACEQAAPQLQQLLMMAAQAPPSLDPMTGQPIDPVEEVMGQMCGEIAERVAKPEEDDDCDTIIRVYTEYRRSPEGQQQDDFIRKSILAAIAIEMFAKSQQDIMFQQLAARTQIQGAAPMRDQAMQDQEMQAGQQDQMAATDHSRQEESKESDHERQMEMADHGAEHKEREAEVGHSRNVEIETMRHHSKIAEQKAKPKPGGKK